MIANRLPADERGSTVVEFGICAGLLLLLLSAGVEFGMLFFVDSSLQSAVLAASRFGITGASGDGVSREAQILTIIGERATGLIDIAKADVTTLTYPSFNDIGKPEPFTDANGNGSFDAGEAYSDINGNGAWDADMGAAGLGGPGDVVVYRIRYPWETLTPLMAPFLDGRSLSAAVAVRNEPF